MTTTTAIPRIRHDATPPFCASEYTWKSAVLKATHHHVRFMFPACGVKTLKPQVIAGRKAAPGSIDGGAESG